MCLIYKRHTVFYDVMFCEIKFLLKEYLFIEKSLFTGQTFHLQLLDFFSTFAVKTNFVLKSLHTDSNSSTGQNSLKEFTAYI